MAELFLGFPGHLIIKDSEKYLLQLMKFYLSDHLVQTVGKRLALMFFWLSNGTLDTGTMSPGL